jgi:hypothetical protein
MKQKRFNLTFLLFLCLSLLSCEPRLNAKLLEGYPPTFHFDGDDTMLQFFVCPELPEDQCNEKNAIWSVTPDSAHNKSWPLDITYGTTPQGFSQINPKNGERPPALESEKRYIYHFVKGHGEGGGRFIIRGGKAIVE